MNPPFSTALDFVHETLRELDQQGVKMRATKAALQRLAAANAGPALPPTVAKAEPVVKMEGAGRIAESPGLESAPGLSGVVGSKAERLAVWAERARNCEKCAHLAASRTQVVFGVGNPEAELMLIGEAPGEEEDFEGVPFVGKAGQLLTKIIETMGFSREEVYLANVLKCRPDVAEGQVGNREPKSAEMEACLPYLREQIAIIEPKVIVALGASAMKGLLGQTQPMARLRGQWYDFAGIPVMATYHPAYLLHNQALSEKRKLWEDLLLVLERLERSISVKQRNFFLPKV